MNSFEQKEQTGESRQPATEEHGEEALTILRRSPVFRSASLEMVKLYAYLSRREEYEAGDIILRQGGASDRLLLITSGKVAVTFIRGKVELLLQELSADSLNYFGELALICDTDWVFTAHARSHVTLLSLSREAFRKVVERFPETYMETVEEIIKLRIQRYNSQAGYLIDRLGEDVLAKLAFR
jgi:CRP-like cAMP-binding protein